ncbi:hypothetical protein PENSPDRAFT_645104 [Peniophora sp. CONT]|nr:hypothetical protein PENSPDRAFT_645104 [Peniophora sp. CONT]
MVLVRYAPPPVSPFYSSDSQLSMTLPPIASFDVHHQPALRSYAQFPARRDASDAPVAPPPYLPPIQTPRSLARSQQPIAGLSRTLTPSPTPPPEQVAEISDWFRDAQPWSSFALAEKTCEMICYLWFSKAASSPDPSRQSSPHLSYIPHRSANTAFLQFNVSSIFTNFMHKLLQTTQLSQSVIVLSLHYIYRLKARNCTTVPSPGSEFRVAVAGLMMANKFVDDNTYTNKTWSEVSGIDLTEINKMEREILSGINYELYVDQQTYDNWVNLLKGLVLSKEKDSRYFRRSRQTRAVTVTRPAPLATPHYPRHAAKLTMSPRARSSSPVRYTTENLVTQHHQYSPAMHMAVDADTPSRLRGKRTALDAFSPTSASFDLERPAKRPGLALDIPQALSRPSPMTPSPLEGIQFSRLSLGTSPAGQQVNGVPSQTLVAAYRLDPTKPRSVPQHLYYYSLAGSPLSDEKRSHKGRLHVHQPPPLTAPQFAYSHQPAPVTIQSAHASPHERAPQLPPVLPNPHDSVWTQSRSRYDAAYPSATPSFRPESAQESPFAAQRPVAPSTVPSAPFANAGPPGVHYYAYPPQSSSGYYLPRGRRP